LRVARGLLCLHETLHALAAKRLLMSRRHFEEASQGLLLHVRKAWMQHMQALVNQVGSAAQRTNRC